MLDRSYINWFNQLRDRFESQVHQPSPEAPAPPEPRTLGLALGGGGGKGAAHIGVIEVLEKLNVPIDVIVGTSAGGAVAVMHAAGFGPEEIHALFRAMSLRRIAVPDPTRTGLIGQRRRIEILSRLFGDRTFDDLRTPCAVTAVDLISGQCVVIDKGPLIDAVLATTAVPGILPPVPYEDKLLVDGGILNNLPIDVAKSLGARRVVAVELNDAVPGFNLLPAEVANPFARLMLAPQQFAVANRALSLLMNHATALQLRDNPPDLLLSPDVSAIATLDLSAPEKGHEVGIAAAHAARNELMNLRDWRLEEPEPAETPVPAAPPEPVWPKLALPFAFPRWGENSSQQEPSSTA